MIEILYNDNNIVFCVKPAGISSETDLPKALGEQLGCDIYTLHRLDNPVGGVMVYAKTKEAAAKFSRKIADNTDFEKTYLAVCEGELDAPAGEMQDLLFKDSSRNKSFVVKKERKGVKKASLSYRVVATAEYKGRVCSLVEITLHTGRSHQIRVQFASRKHPLLGDGKYGSKVNCHIALFSHRIQTDGKSFCKNPPLEAPWSAFEGVILNRKGASYEDAQQKTEHIKNCVNKELGL